mgnify:FL=1
MYQAENASAVTEIIGVLNQKGYAISEDAMRDGFKYAQWQARYEFVTPDIVIDGGHNKDGIRVLKESLKAEKRPITLVITMMKDKDYAECISDIISVSIRKVQQ